MFIPFLAAAAVATTFAQLDAMTVRISIHTLAPKTMSFALLAATIAAVALFMRTRRGNLK